VIVAALVPTALSTEYQLLSTAAREREHFELRRELLQVSRIGSSEVGDAENWAEVFAAHQPTSYHLKPVDGYDSVYRARFKNCIAKAVPL